MSKTKRCLACCGILSLILLGLNKFRSIGAGFELRDELALRIVIRSNDIVAYDPTRHVLELNDSAREAIKQEKPGSMIAVCVDGTPIYYTRVWATYFSRYAKPTKGAVIFPGGMVQNMLEITIGPPGNPQQGIDQRGNARILDALKRQIDNFSKKK